MNELNDRQSGDWDACPQGTLTEAADGIRRRRRNKEVTRLAVAAVGVFAVVAVGVFAFQQSVPQPGFEFGDITCAETLSLLQNYAAGSLDAETSGKIDRHLQQCPHCSPLYDRMKSGAGKAVSQIWPCCDECEWCRVRARSSFSMVATLD